MIFGTLAVDEAEGALLGHGLTVGCRKLRKGHRLSAADIDVLRAAGVRSVTAARLEAGDVPEDRAAETVAKAAAGPGVKVQAPFTGRCNLYAERRGLAVVDGRRVDRLNALDEAITLATIPPFELVAPGQMLATVKVIPFAADADAIERAARIAADEKPLIEVAEFVHRRVGLVVTRLPETKDSVVEKTIAMTRHRLESLGSELSASVTCAHDAAALAGHIRAFHEQGLSPILVFGASAIVDRRDVIPTAIELSGGAVDHFGMPVDPGNLLLLGHIRQVPVVGLPGCARSPKPNGFDWVLRRLLAGLQVRRAEIVRLGVGGLLMEIPSRPQPRAGTPAAYPRAARIAALVLAAGRSRRMGRNKLLAPVQGRPMVSHVVDALLASSARPIIVVTGHEPEALRAALEGRDVVFVHNPDYAEGLSTSLKAGLTALPTGCDGALVCLGDMPKLRSRHVERLIAAFNPAEGRAICVPTFSGERGNPVLWGADYFEEMQTVKGDTGAKHLIGTYDDHVCEVTMEDDAVLRDIDTPQALADLEA